MCALGRSGLTNATKREQYSTAPSAPRISWGKSHAGSESWGDGPYSARGRCHSDTFTYANSQSGNVGKPRQQDLSIPFRPFSFTAQSVSDGDVRVDGPRRHPSCQGVNVCNAAREPPHD